MTYNFCDEYGQPYILIKEQGERRKTEEKNVLAENVKAFCEIVDTLNTSVGPFGADKMIVSPDGDIVITNDGATILKEIEIEGSPMGKLITQLSNAQDDEVGDGTTGVVIIAAALLREAEMLARKGMHPLRIIRGYEEALDAALEAIDENTRQLEKEEMDKAMREIAESTLSSKVVSREIDRYISIAIDAVKAVEDDKRVANLELIKIEGTTKIGRSELIRGVYISKGFSHMQMEKKVANAKIALLACPFEPPKAKIKHEVNVESIEEFEKLSQYERKVFIDMVEKIKESGANVVLCQWGFDDEANSLLMQAGISAVRWVGAQELEMVAIHTGAHIVSRFEDLSPSLLGEATVIEKDETIRVESEKRGKAVTILIRCGTTAQIEETKRSIRDALCAIRNIRRDPKIVPGAGKIDMLCSEAVEKKVIGLIGRSYARALKDLPKALAKNMGEDPIERITCGLADNVWEGAFAKKHQYILATQTAKSVLRIDDVIGTNTR